jgi:hypothetical protein
MSLLLLVLNRTIVHAHMPLPCHHPGACPPEYRTRSFSISAEALTNQCLDKSGNATALAACVGPPSPNYSCAASEWRR